MQKQKYQQMYKKNYQKMNRKNYKKQKVKILNVIKLNKMTYNKKGGQDHEKATTKNMYGM